MTKREGLKKRKLPVTKRLHDQFVMVYVQPSNVGTVHCVYDALFQLLISAVHMVDCVSKRDMLVFPTLW